jgi:hypothetical protein
MSPHPDGRRRRARGARMRRAGAVAVGIAAAAASLATAACGDEGESAEIGSAPRASVPPASEFVRVVDNAWFPLIPGSRYHWEGTSRDQPVSDDLTVTHATERVAGVVTTVVRDRSYRRGRLVEATTDWYAQDRQGNVWYFGEATRTLDGHGKVVSREGSWRAGVDGAAAGIFMPGRPHVGQTVRQEYLKGHAEDHAEIRSLHATVRTPYVSSRRALRTTETSPIEPGVVDAKYYVRGIGTVVEASVKGPEHERLELVSFSRG